jgi:peroxiredoxin
LVLIGVHADPNAAEMRKAVKELQIPWPVALDGDKKLFKAVGADSYPDYYVIDRKGRVRFADLANAEVDRAVAVLIKERP